MIKEKLNSTVYFSSGQQIKLLRKQKNLTQCQLANLVGIQQSKLSEIEARQNLDMIRLNLMKKFVSVLVEDN